MKETTMSVDKRVTEDLMEALRDSKDGFSASSERLSGCGRADLAAKFGAYATQRAQFAADLETLAATYRDDPETPDSLGATVQRAWAKVKGSVTGADLMAVLQGAAEAEQDVLVAYEAALGEDISPGLRSAAMRQRDEIHRINNEMQMLCDTTLVTPTS